ncbi:selenoprotein S-like [Clytia hemisphaerica]|uniref:Selenoprotein S n=1 Tax=Clytia hemisphaerica TaxID=252671 RepID=A0A7M6DRS4_9CNID|eukprot:TCONS_00068982-protein
MTLQNETPPILASNFSIIVGVIEQYGWFLLIGCILVMYLYNKYKPTLMKMKQNHEDWKEAEINKKDPDRVHKVQLSMEQARLKLQQQVNVDSEKRKEADLKREEAQRQKKIEEWENHQQGRGYHNKSRFSNPSPDNDSGSNNTSKPKKKNTTMKSDFNALSGDGGGSCSYRPSSRFSGGG